MKKINLPGFSFSKESGEIATILTLATVILMIVGIFLGTKLTKKPIDLTTKASEAATGASGNQPILATPTPV